MNKKQRQHKTILPGNPNGVAVLGPEREDIAFALKTFKRKVKSAGIIEKLRNRKEFTKPSVENRKMKQRAAFIQKIKSQNN
jgi:small subunit ribosomal protein S21